MPSLSSADEGLSGLLRAADKLYADQQQAVQGGTGGGHTRAVGVCLGSPEAGLLVGAVAMYERVGQSLGAWLAAGEGKRGGGMGAWGQGSVAGLLCSRETRIISISRAPWVDTPLSVNCPPPPPF